MAHLLGYARISTGDQHPDLQVDALKAAGSYRVFADTASGALAARPALDQVFDQLRPGDEGFGSLDDLGRQGMIDELHTLASQLDRVIVVSHQADFSDTAYFPNGYSLRKAGRHTEVSRLIA
jgi:DNA invertase Pin-like site-specific DNA recombinase